MILRPTHSRVIMPAAITGRDSTAQYAMCGHGRVARHGAAREHADTVRRRKAESRGRSLSTPLDERLADAVATPAFARILAENFAIRLRSRQPLGRRHSIR
jgi:hypothetical protein